MRSVICTGVSEEKHSTWKRIYMAHLNNESKSPIPRYHLLRALQSRNYRLFFIGQSISLIGTLMQQVAMSWLPCCIRE
ncbi:MAG: hypothetical protein WA003_03360 [Desulfuromonadaceae bacterium]